MRWVNALTEGKPFALMLTLLLGVSAIAGAWAIGLATAEEPNPAVVVAPDPTHTAVPSVRPTPAVSAGSQTPEHRYVVRRGDTLRKIAREIYGDETMWTAILEANRDLIDDPDNLVIGTSLLIPDR